MFNVLISVADLQSDGIQSVSEAGDHIVGSLPLSNGETVWLQARDAVMSPHERKEITSVERQFQGFSAPGNLDNIDAWGIYISTSVEGLPLLVQFQLGRHHFQG